MAAPLPLAGVDAIASAYGLGAVRECRVVAEGVLNRNWRLVTDAGAFALKELDQTSPDDARRSLALMVSVAADGVPVVAAVPTGSGKSVLELGVHAYYLAPWIDGDHRRGAEMTRATAFHMGEVLARVRLALARPGLLPEAAPRFEPPPTVATASERIGDYLRLIDGRDAPDEFDRAVAPLLRTRLDLVAANEHQRPSEDGFTGPHGWTHGDCQNWNLLWRDDRIAAVLDWDRVRVNPYAEEIVRAATYQCALADGSLDLDHLAAVVAGYRTFAPIGGEALLDAARRRWWKLLTSVWHLKYHYFLGNNAGDWLFFSDERLLRWWTDHLHEVESTLAG